MNVHLIATGGAVMHNLALALYKAGHNVTGSDDAIYEPAKSRLEAYELLPALGWHAERITPDLDLVILGMHAKADNPELLRAQELGLKVMSFPEFLGKHAMGKQRVVVAGSHGKTTVTSMIMHVLARLEKDFDYAVGSSIHGFEDSVRLSDNSPLMVLEGDEYLSSPLDRRPKFVHYHPHIAVLNGIAWDHINVFPTYEIYLQQFRDFLRSMQEGATLIYPSTDAEVEAMVLEEGMHLNCIPAAVPDYEFQHGHTVVRSNGNVYLLEVFGRHNMMNLSVAQAVCAGLGIDANDFWTSAQSFKGAGKRMEPVDNRRKVQLFRDFAHAPSKVDATVKAVREAYPDKKITAILELHTFSSLNRNFIGQYAGTLDPADEAVVYVDNVAVAAKGGDSYTEDQIRKAFAREDIQFLDDATAFRVRINEAMQPDTVLLLMSSGNLGGLDLNALAEGE